MSSTENTRRSPLLILFMLVAVGYGCDDDGSSGGGYSSSDSIGGDASASYDSYYYSDSSSYPDSSSPSYPDGTASDSWANPDQVDPEDPDSQEADVNEGDNYDPPGTNPFVRRCAYRAGNSARRSCLPDPRSSRFAPFPVARRLIGSRMP